MVLLLLIGSSIDRNFTSFFLAHHFMIKRMLCAVYTHCWNTRAGYFTPFTDADRFLTVFSRCVRQETDVLLQELRSARFFDVFEYNGMQQQWGCFLCNHPEKAEGFVKVRGRLQREGAEVYRAESHDFKRGLSDMVLFYEILK